MYSKKLKGFTLIEMIVVIAIITVLAGIMSLAISGFMRDSRIETNQKKAQMVYTGFQNILIQCEINQNASWLNADPTGANHDDSKLVAVQVLFHVAEEGDIGHYGKTDLGTVQVTSFYSDGGSGVTSTHDWKATESAKTDMRKEAETDIFGNLDSSFEGTVAVFINYEDYTVDSVVYRELNGRKDPHVDYTRLSNWDDSSATTKNKNYKYHTAKDHAEIRTLVDGGTYYGAYPYHNSLT